MRILFENGFQPATGAESVAPAPPGMVAKSKRHAAAALLLKPNPLEEGHYTVTKGRTEKGGSFLGEKSEPQIIGFDTSIKTRKDIAAHINDVLREEELIAATVALDETKTLKDLHKSFDQLDWIALCQRLEENMGITIDMPKQQGPFEGADFRIGEIIDFLAKGLGLPES